MRRLSGLCLIACVAAWAGPWLSPGAPGAGSVPDRLEAFRLLAASRLGVAETVGDDADEVRRDVYRLLDEEIVENLASGGVFASTEFIQDRLDAFTAAWGGAALRVLNAGPLVVGVFQVSESRIGDSVRVYGGGGQNAGLLATFTRAGRPSISVMPRAGGRVPAFVVAWEGLPGATGSRELRLDLLAPHGDRVRVVWSTADLYPEGLMARAYSVRDREVRVRYEVHYPGWTFGCEGQTEQEDIYRLAADSPTFVLANRREHNGWHRRLRRAVAPLFAALAEGKSGGLRALVPNRALRERLPPTLRPAVACDAVESAGPGTVSIAATDERGPWQLIFKRAGDDWRLTDVRPVQP